MNPFDNYDDDDYDDDNYDNKTRLLRSSNKNNGQQQTSGKWSTPKRLCCTCCSCLVICTCVAVVCIVSATLVMVMFVKNGKLGSLCDLVISTQLGGGTLNRTREDVFHSIESACQLSSFHLISSQFNPLQTSFINCNHVVWFTQNITIQMEVQNSQSLVIRASSVSDRKKKKIFNYDFGQNYRNLKELWKLAKLRVTSEDRIEGCWFPYD